MYISCPHDNVVPDHSIPVHSINYYIQPGNTVSKGPLLRSVVVYTSTELYMNILKLHPVQYIYCILDRPRESYGGRGNAQKGPLQLSNPMNGSIAMCLLFGQINVLPIKEEKARQMEVGSRPHKSRA